MMDIKGSEDKLKDVDSFLTTLTKVLKKHWFLLILILAGCFVYWVFSIPDEEIYDETESVDDGTIVEDDSIEYADSSYYYE